jgi:hypothetical protein
LGVLTGETGVLVDVVTRVFIERQEQALEISAARNLANNTGTECALRFNLSGPTVGIGVTVVVVIVVIVVTTN